MKQRAPALPDSPTFQQLWDALGSRLIETAQGNLLYTQGVRGSSPLPPTMNMILTFGQVLEGTKGAHLAKFPKSVTGKKYPRRQAITSRRLKS